MESSHFIVPVGSSLWWYGWGIGVLLSIFFLWGGQILKSKNREKEFRCFLSILLAARFIGSFIYFFYTDKFSVAASLPLQLCSFSSLLCIIYLVFPTILLFEFLFLLSSVGGLMSMITPEITHGYSPYLFIEYYIEHASLILTPIYGYIILNHRVRAYAWLRIWIAGNLLMVLIAITNKVLNANYMYLCVKPKVDNPLVMGEFPYYILGFELLGTVIICAMYWLSKNGNKTIT